MMNIKNIDEIENLIIKYRQIMAAKEQIEVINGEDSGASESFVLIDGDTNQAIVLHNLKAESLEAVDGVLNEKCDKILARLREL